MRAALVVLALFPITLARGQEAAAPQPFPAGKAREVAWKFLAEGEGAPRPGLGKLAFASAEGYPFESPLPSHRGPLLELCWPASDEGKGQLTVGVSRAGRVLSYNAFDQAFRIERWNPDYSARDPEEIAEELAQRTKFTPEQLEERALRFLRHAVRDFTKRRFVRYRSQARTDNPILHSFAWQEEAPDGVLAVYPNRVSVDMNPETGEVAMFLATDVEEVVKDPPPITGPRAEELAQAKHAGAPVVAERFLSLILKQGQARPVWAIQLGGERPAVVLVDANTGELLDLNES